MSDWGKNTIEAIINRFGSKKVLVIGDLMVDEYITGRVRRVSPEAPVPVLDFIERSLEAGGASNVAHNIRSLGADVYVVGTVADDEGGKWLRKHFQQLGICTEGIFSEEGRPTTLKTRYATKGQQLLRVDNENAKCILHDTRERMYAYIDMIINRLDVVIMSDYKKGVLEDSGFVQRIIRLCNEHDVLTAVDSKSRNIKNFAGVDFVKPNNLELEQAVGIQIEDDESLSRAGETYLERSGANALIVTRGSKGITVFLPREGRRDYPAKDVQVYDVCGAGDTVISTISMGIASGLKLCEAVKLANLAAGIVINKVGTVAVKPEELVNSIYEEQNNNAG